MIRAGPCRFRRVATLASDIIQGVAPHLTSHLLLAYTVSCIDRTGKCSGATVELAFKHEACLHAYRLGTSKQKWTDDEEKALRAGVDK